MPRLAVLRLDVGPPVPDQVGLCPWWAFHTNAELKRLCLAIEKHPTVRALSIPLLASNQLFPAIQDLLCHGTGLDSIELECTALSWSNLDLLVRAMHSTHLDLKHLSLTFSHSDWDDSEYGRILRALCTNPSLEQFDLSWKESDPPPPPPPLGTLNQCALGLRDVLVANTALKRLRLPGVPAAALSGCFDQLLAGLTVNRTLRYVAVEPLVPVGTAASSLVPPPAQICDRVEELLEHNAVIRTFPGFGTSSAPTHDLPDAAARVTFLLALNAHGRRALMPGQDIPIDCWSALLGRISAGSGSDGETDGSGTTAVGAWPCAVLYHFLRAKPALIRPRDNPTKRARQNDETAISTDDGATTDGLESLRVRCPRIDGGENVPRSTPPELQNMIRHVRSPRGQSLPPTPNAREFVADGTFTV